MSTAKKIPLIEDAFAWKIAYEYVRIYRKDGFDGAAAYLDRTIGGDNDLRNIIIPMIVTLGDQK